MPDTLMMDVMTFEMGLAAAQRAQSNGDFTTAIWIWAQLRRNRPDRVEPFVRAAGLLRESKRDQEADLLMAEALAQMPDKPAIFIDHARAADARGDRDEALRRWEDAASRFADMQQIIDGLAAARRLVSSSQPSEPAAPAPTNKVVSEPAVAEPAPEDRIENILDRATQAEHARDWNTARELWSVAKDRAPTHAAGYLGMARALREIGKIAEADEILTDAAGRFPNDAGVASERCWLMQVARNYKQAISRWADLRSRFPDLYVGWTAGALALRELRAFDEAEALLRDALARFPNEPNIVVDHAWLASARRTWPEAAARWENIRTRFPERPEGYLRGALALTEIWRYDEAEAVLSDGMARFPDDPAFVVEYAQVAAHQNRMEEASERFASIRRRFPNLPEAYLGEARARRNQFRLDEAERLLQLGMEALPSEPRFQYEYAMLPVFAPLRRDREPEKTLERLAVLRERFPKFENGYAAAIRLYRDERQFDEADRIATLGVEQVPSSRTIAVEQANTALDRNDPSQAIALFTEIRQRFPDDVAGSIGLGKALALVGRRSEAEDALRDATERFPGIQAAFMAYAEIAIQAEDWREALVRLLEAQKRFPDDNSFPQRISDVRLHLIGQENEQSEGQAADSDNDDPRAAFRELIIQFESLGGRGIGCEFGMFQREFGAEPLGLLRWADMPYDGIIWVLENRFEGVGLPENTDVFVNRENSRPEYCTKDLRGFMFMRAFVYEDEMPIEKMRQQALRRLGFLKKKLISDLEAGEKIFLWRSTERNLMDTELDRLHAAVRSYGDNVLFYVRYADAEHPLGTVEIVKPGLMIGYIDRFKMDRAGNLAATPPSASWTMLCQKAFDMFAEAKG